MPYDEQTGRWIPDLNQANPNIRDVPSIPMNVPPYFERPEFNPSSYYQNYNTPAYRPSFEPSNYYQDYNTGTVPLQPHPNAATEEQLMQFFGEAPYMLENFGNSMMSLGDLSWEDYFPSAQNNVYMPTIANGAQPTTPPPATPGAVDDSGGFTAWLNNTAGGASRGVADWLSRQGDALFGDAFSGGGGRQSGAPSPAGGRRGGVGTTTAGRPAPGGSAASNLAIHAAIQAETRKNIQQGMSPAAAQAAAQQKVASSGLGVGRAAGSPAGSGGGALGGGGSSTGNKSTNSGIPAGYVMHPTGAGLVKLNREGHGDFGEGYDSLGNRAIGGRGTGVPDRVLKQQFEIMKRMGQVDWTGSFVNWKKNGMPPAGKYTPEQMAELVSGRADPWDFANQTPAPGAPGAPATPGAPPGTTGPNQPPNWAVPGLGPWSPPMGQPGQPAYPPLNPNAPPSGIVRDESNTNSAAVVSGPGFGTMPQPGTQPRQSAMGGDPNYIPGDNPNDRSVGAYGGGQGAGLTPNGRPPYNGVPGGDYSLPYFTQPSYSANMTPEQLQYYHAYNTSVALPWAEYMSNTYQNNRDYDRDVFTNDRQYGRNVYMDDRNFGEDTRRYNQGFGEDQFRDRRNFGEDTRRYDESLDWQKKADAMRTFGARQMPNVKQMSFR